MSISYINTVLLCFTSASNNLSIDVWYRYIGRVLAMAIQLPEVV